MDFSMMAQNVMEAIQWRDDAMSAQADIMKLQNQLIVELYSKIDPSADLSKASRIIDKINAVIEKACES